MTTLKESFDRHRDSCLAVCEEWDKKQRNPLDDLKHQIKDPTAAWHNYKARMDIWKILDRVKTWVYSIIGCALFEDPKYQDLYQWLNGYYGSFGWHDLPLEYSPISPQALRQAEFRDGDELWYWSTPEETWNHMFGRAGYCIVRGGMIVWSITTELN